ncbi:uncharacterized protein ATNIH1004_009025 [Aspergillus tanneri]|uniref:Uncharacterized protein n=1 Tax=Aspergillus tanneri TaxID=1220188 RepID=A0A5M9MQF6_9EURO|nr:uncharacterized protein ATNIH1004_009025 [Aspergillus tanneri]KAA8644817.1 hypothetical protein ATNIH1004_009025 [Aspergillus tanneri]
MEIVALHDFPDEGSRGADAGLLEDRSRSLRLVQDGHGGGDIGTVNYLTLESVLFVDPHRVWTTKIEVGLVSPRESDWVQWWDEPQQDQFGDEAAGVMAIDLPGGQVKEWDYNLVNQRGTDSAVQQAGWMSMFD